MSQPYPGEDSTSEPSPPPYGQLPHAPPAPPAPPYGQPAPYGPPPHPQPGGAQGQLVLNLLKPAGWGSASMITPIVHIDGYPAPAQWDRNVYPVPAGPRQVTVDSHYLWNYGRQQTVADVHPGRSVEVFYAGPLVSFGAGAMGYEVQKRPGKVAMVLLLSPILLILLLVLGAIIVGN